MKVFWTKTAQKDWSRFSECARQRFPNEYIESVIGRVSNGRIFIHFLWPLKHTSGKRSANPSERDVLTHKLYATKQKMQWLGFLHTHPDEPAPYLSSTDHKCGKDHGSILMGSCQVTGKKTLKVHHPYWLIPHVIEQSGI